MKQSQRTHRSRKPSAIAGIARAGAAPRLAVLLAALLAAVLGSGCAMADAPGATPAAHPVAAPLPDYAPVIASALRTDEDRKSDERRKPLELLRFAQVQPGMQVLDVSAGGGYTTQLLALAVGDRGSVWAQMPKVRAGWEKRMAEHPQANIHALVRPFDDPYPADAPRLDLITFVLNYHDVVNTPTDRKVMNRRLFEALRPGGHLVVIDHAAAPGAGLTQTNTLHRIAEDAVLQELHQAGFELEERSGFLAAPADPHTQAFWDLQGPSDRFALRLRRP